MIASQRQYSLDFIEKLKILYFKKNNQHIENNFSKLFSGKWTVLSINIMEKKLVEWKLSL